MVSNCAKAWLLPRVRSHSMGPSWTRTLLALNQMTSDETTTHLANKCHTRSFAISHRQTHVMGNSDICTKWQRILQRVARYYSRDIPIMNVFDRNTKRMQRNRTASLENCEVYDYIKEEIGWRTADRISDVKRKFDVAVDLGCGRGHVSKHIYSDMVETLYMTDMAEDVLAQAEISPEVPTTKIHADEEDLPFKPDSLNLVVSSLSLHWVNDLPGTLKQVHRALKNDGCFIGAMFGGDTLFELRVALQLAETENEGGIAAHVSPFTSVQDLGGLLNSTGYTMLTIDIDELVIRYPSMFELMKDIKGMGESNCAWNRRPMIPRDTLKRAAEIYKERFGSDGAEGVPATYQVINFIAWKPDKSQRQAAKRGSGQVSLKDLDKVDVMMKEIDGLQEGTPGDERLSRSVQQLAQDIEKLRKATSEDPDGDRK